MDIEIIINVRINHLLSWFRGKVELLTENVRSIFSAFEVLNFTNMTVFKNRLYLEITVHTSYLSLTNCLNT